MTCRPTLQAQILHPQHQPSARLSFASNSGCNDEARDPFGNNACRTLAEMGVVCQQDESVTGADVVPAAMKNMVLELHFYD